MRRLLMATLILVTCGGCTSITSHILTHLMNPGWNCRAEESEEKDRKDVPQEPQ